MQIKHWLIWDATNGWQDGEVIERIPEARCLGAYQCAGWTADGKPDNRVRWRLAQQHGLPEPYNGCFEDLFEADGWRSDWPDLVRLKWTPRSAEAQVSD